MFCLRVDVYLLKPTIASPESKELLPPTITTTTTPLNSKFFASVSEVVTHFTSMMEVCRLEKIIPREAVLRNIYYVRIQKQFPGSRPCPADFESWLITLIENNQCTVEGKSPRRIIWPPPPATRFECVDYWFSDLTHFSNEDITDIIKFLQSIFVVNNSSNNNNSNKRNKGRNENKDGSDSTKMELAPINIGEPRQQQQERFLYAVLLQRDGPPCIRGKPRGYAIQVVQFLLNVHCLRFRRGLVELYPNMVERWHQYQSGNAMLAEQFPPDFLSLCERLHLKTVMHFEHGGPDDC